MLSRTDGRAGGGEARPRVLLRDSGGQTPSIRVSYCHTYSDSGDDRIIIPDCAEVFRQRGDGDGTASPKPISR